MKKHIHLLLLLTSLLAVVKLPAQNASQVQLKYKNSALYAGIDIGSKGVKLSVLEVDKNPKRSGTYNVLQETSINTDFISFTEPSFQATLNGLQKLYAAALADYKLSSGQVFTVVSSGVKMQAEKEGKTAWVKQLVDSFRNRIKDPSKEVEVIDVAQEARLSHLGIVPESKRYTTFLIDIGSGNTKGGYFPNGNTKEMKLFNLNWGTRSVANATERRMEDDKSIANFSRQLNRVLAGEADAEVVYAVNASGAYNMSDNIAVSGGAAWAAATLISPELIDNPVVPVTYGDVAKLFETLSKDYASLSDASLAQRISDPAIDKAAAAKEIKRVHGVFDQKSLLAGTGLLLKIMRQFEGIYEKKQFYLIKNGQVGWISAYVNQTIAK
jgi:hypothetical protein